MKILMLVSVSRSDGFCATQGQVIELDDAELSAEMLANGWAVAAESQPSSVVSHQSTVRRSGESAVSHHAVCITDLTKITDANGSAIHEGDTLICDGNAYIVRWSEPHQQWGGFTQEGKFAPLSLIVNYKGAVRKAGE
jgi:hypothetical protein